MAQSFFFYDLETSGFSPREARTMQFAGQRTDMDLQPVGEPVNLLIRLTPDVLPEPDAVLLTGITPQQTVAEGLTEAEFLKFFYEEVVQPNTTFLGYNSVRFDDEFMRFLHYRNFYDPYEWQWRDGCSRWDLLDLVRLTRALRPEGIEWPFTPEGKPTNRLELLTKLNGLDHEHAHDALNDVMATIAVARLIRDKHRELFDYAFEIRGKKQVAELVLKGAPFVYTSGRYPSETLHTTAAVLLAEHPQDGALVYDLRHDPAQFLDLDVDALVKAWAFTRDPKQLRLPVKTLKYNRCPAVAPLGVMKAAESQERLHLSLDTIAKHLETLKQHQSTFADKVLQAVARLDQERSQVQTTLVEDEFSVDGRLYEGFFDNHDKNLMRVVRAAQPAELGEELGADLHDKRLQQLVPLYKARNYSAQLTTEERTAWDAFCARKLLQGEKQSRLAKYFNRLSELAQTDKLSDEKRYLLEELRLYGESIVPADAAD